MPRSARLDIIGVLQHVIVRGIEKRDIFLDDIDRQSFLERFSRLLEETETDCLAWSLMSNHFHLLLRPKREKLGPFMRRLLTGYAVSFNLRYRRSGYLFQNRFKSIVCEEDPYLLELVRYIHLNPLRVGLVSDLNELDKYSWAGHAVLLGQRKFSNQKSDEVLRYFGRQPKEARAKYREFIGDGVAKGYRNELVEGGLRRVLKMAVDDKPVAYDERVLGSGEFVERVLQGKGPETSYLAVPLTDLVNRIAEVMGIPPEMIRGQGRSKAVTDARSVISCLAYRKIGHNGETVAKALGITRSGVCKRASAGEEIIAGNKELSEICQQLTTVPS